MSTVSETPVKQTGLTLTNQVPATVEKKAIVIKKQYDDTAFSQYGLVTDKGEISLDGLNVMERLSVLAEFKEKNKLNMPMWDVAMSSDVLDGAKVSPIALVPEPSDAWEGEDAKKMKLKDGFVEPSADFLIKLGRAMGVQLVLTFHDVVVIDNIQFYSVKYSASLRLPSGELLTEEGVGKCQPLNNVNGIQAHIAENTEKKAKRNAIKALLGLPTSMKEEEFKRPWLVFRTNFSQCGGAFLLEEKRQAEEAKAKLYTQEASSTEITIMAEGEMKSFIDRLQAVDNLETLNALELELKSKPMSVEQKRELGALYKAAKTRLGAAS